MVHSKILLYDTICNSGSQSIANCDAFFIPIKAMNPNTIMFKNCIIIFLCERGDIDKLQRQPITTPATLGWGTVGRFGSLPPQFKRNLPQWGFFLNLLCDFFCLTLSKEKRLCHKHFFFVLLLFRLFNRMFPNQKRCYCFLSSLHLITELFPCLVCMDWFWFLHFYLFPVFILYNDCSTRAFNNTIVHKL